MKLIIIMALTLFIIASCHRYRFPSTTNYANSEIKNETNQTILAGHCSINMLQASGYKEWFDKSYNGYAVDTEIVAKLKPLLQHKTIEIFLGSWCGDSKREVPRMLKILAAADFDTSNVKLIFVDNSTATYKQSPQHEEAGKNIHHVPTFIFYNGKKEMNRIVESPIVSLEKDALAILQKQAYAPNYKAITYWQKNVKSKQVLMVDLQLQQLAETIKPLCKHSGELNALGYILLAQKSNVEAINIFKLNAAIYPEKATVYDSLGEAYNTMDNKEDAKKCYEKVLRIDPSNANAKMMLEKIK